MNDILGTPLAVGDKVATDVTYRRSSRLRVGTLTAVEGQWVRVSYEVSDWQGKARKQSVLREPSGVVKVSGTETPSAVQP